MQLMEITWCVTNICELVSCSVAVFCLITEQIWANIVSVLFVILITFPHTEMI